LVEAFGSLYLDEFSRGRLADFASHRMAAGVEGARVRRDLATPSWSFRVRSPGITSTPVQKSSSASGISESRLPNPLNPQPLPFEIVL
jgi:hypothetical protein